MTREKLLSRRQRGAVAVLVSVALLSLIAMLGLVVDVSHLYIAKTELADAADACSLAAASQLTGVNIGPSPNQLDLAESAGTTVGQRNRVNFQGTNVVIVPNSTVTFSDHLNGIYSVKTAITGANVAAMKYARCVLPIADTISTGIIPYFMQVVLGPAAQAASAKAVGGQAVATLASGITNCGIPVGMCKVTPLPATCPHGQSVDAYGLCKGEWYCSKFTPGSSNPGVCSGAGLTGNFNIIDYGLGGGASTLAALLTGTGQCALTSGILTGRTGAVSSLSDAWNTRFGINKGGSTGTPDLSGYSYTSNNYQPGYSPGGNWNSEYNVFSGTTPGVDNFQTSRSKNTPYQGDYVPNLGGVPGPPGTNGSTYLTQSQLASTGADRRLAVVPVVDCSAYAGSTQAPILAFACILMLHPWAAPGDPLYLEYEGLSNLLNSPCATAGLPGGPASVGPKVPSLVR